MTNQMPISRRELFEVATCTLLATSAVPGQAMAEVAVSAGAASDQMLRKYYAAWSSHDWQTVSSFFDDSFTFSSAAGDDHIPLSAFKAQCWDTQSPYIGRFELLRVLAASSDAFVIYLCHMKNGKTFRNIEYSRLKGDKIKSIECYFGAAAGYPTAVGVK